MNTLRSHFYHEEYPDPMLQKQEKREPFERSELLVVAGLLFGSSSNMKGKAGKQLT